MLMRLALLSLLSLATLSAAGRSTLSLDGTWQIADSKDGSAIPTRFEHTAPVPGLAHSSTPAFPDVDQFESRQLLQNRVAQKIAPPSVLVEGAGRSLQERNWFWYHRTFRVPERRRVATLRINKAQFGAAVWLNGHKIGEHLPCFSAAVFDVTAHLNWTGENDMVVRVGAHPGVLPPTANYGTDFEKNRWTPGIYDSVSLALSDGPVIESIQAAPRLAESAVLIETILRNPATTPATVTLSHRIHGWKGTATAGASAPQKLTLAPGETKTVTETVRIPNAKLWTPETPNLYVIETSTGGDSVSTRFGMREFRFDTATRRAYLNGKVYFLRGSNITLHRFFEDPVSGTLPWDEAWVRKLLVDIPKRLHWNAFRFCIGPAPERWYEIADEAGLLIQNEYFVWTGRGWHGAANQVHFDAPSMIAEYKEWMRDTWNHPSVAIFDANNETWDPMFGEQIIPAVRPLDLSHRPWENSYNQPQGPDDPVEDHPYEHHHMATGREPFSMTTLEGPGLKGQNAMTGHAMILNEYGWLWLNRDGSPTELTKTLYPLLLGPNSTAAERLELNAYLLAGLSEYWRAYRHYAGVLHFVYLMSSDPLGYTADHFRDVRKLELQPHFEEYMGNAFRPLGVYLSFWHPAVAAGSTRELPVMMVNDTWRRAAGTLTLQLESEDGQVAAARKVDFELAPLGQQTYTVGFSFPARTGRFLLKAIAAPSDAAFDGPTVSRRKVELSASK
jgi:hypothetical protein